MKRIKRRLYLRTLLWMVVSTLIGFDTGNIQAISPELIKAVPWAINSQTLHKGVFLVASPHLKDPNFKESVVLICEYGPGGTIGLVINRPTAFPLSKVFPDISMLEGKPYALFTGGPVQPRGLLMLFRSEVGFANTKEILDGVYWGSDREVVASMVSSQDLQDGFRVYAGYAGWANGQLEAEIAIGGWTTMPADPETIFEKDPTMLWNELNEHPKSPREFISYPTDFAH